MGNGKKKTQRIPAHQTLQAKRVPKQNDIPAPEYISFGFKFWQQKDNFGLDCVGVTKNWFVSLLIRLKDLSYVTVDELMSTRVAGGLRFHTIPWGDKNLTMSKDDFMSLLPTQFQSDETEYYQFQLSKGRGRVHGFLDEKNTFQIVLLDPMHNMHLTKDSNFRIRSTDSLETELEKSELKFESLLHEIEKTCVAECSVKQDLQSELDKTGNKRLFCVTDFLREDEIERAIEVHGSLINLVTEAFDNIIESLDSKNQNSSSIT